MIVKVRKLKREGFTLRLAVEFENGLILYSQGFLWLSSEKIKQISKKFGEMVVELRRLK